MSSPAINYGNYLQLEELLRLQRPQSQPAEHDELLFIVIHQTYELWFKQILHELERLGEKLDAGQTWAAAKTFRRVLTILKTLVSQVDILETMTPLEFNSFRRFLASSSGFQSWQFRELEVLCGRYAQVAIKLQQDVPTQHAQLQARMQQPSLWEHLIRYLNQRGHGLPEPVRVRDEGAIFDPDPALQQRLADIIRSDAEAAHVTELFVDFDEGLQEWRYRHVKMVERTIGGKPGTGGSSGAAYLRSTLMQSSFPDLWALRSLF